MARWWTLCFSIITLLPHYSLQVESPSRRSIASTPQVFHKGPAYLTSNPSSYLNSQASSAVQPWQGSQKAVAQSYQGGQQLAAQQGQWQSSLQQPANQGESASQKQSQSLQFSSVTGGVSGLQSTSAQNGFAANQGSIASSGASSLTSGSEFNPQLLGGVPGNPGVRARINRKAFDFASKLIGPLLDKQIKSAQIPEIRQCLPQVNGCIRVSNVRITSYRCPQRIVAYPAAPNQIVLQVENLDIGVVGDLNGKVEVLAPIALVGSVRLNAQRVSLRVALSVQVQPGGALNIGVSGCKATIGQASVFIDNGGLIGDIANGQLQRKFSQAVRKLLPTQLCLRLPSIVNEQLGGKLSGISTRISVMEILGAALSSLGGIEGLLDLSGDDTDSDASSTGTCGSSCPTAPARFSLKKKKSLAGVALVSQKPVNSKLKTISVMRRKPMATKHKSAMLQRRVSRQDNDTTNCDGCPAKESSGGLGDLIGIVGTLNITKLTEVFLNVNLLGAKATSNDFTIDVTGEFNSDAFFTNPFYPFPVSFPQPVGTKMVEALITDWTINTLFYQLHKVRFLSIKLGPDTAKIGALLKTSCSDDEEEGSGLEDHGVEIEEATSASSPTSDSPAAKRKSKKAVTFNGLVARPKRQDGGSLADLGFCLGDILPGVRDAHPNQKLTVQVSTARAPSVIFKNGGVASLDLLANADFHIESTDEKVGTIQVAATIDLTVTFNGKLGADIVLSRLQLKEIGNSLGLPQETLDNLGNLAKDMLAKQSADNPLWSAKEAVLKIANKAFGNGKEVSLPSGILPFNVPPITLIDPELRVMEHALYLATDITISQQALVDNDLAGDGSCPRRR